MSLELRAAEISSNEGSRRADSGANRLSRVFDLPQHAFDHVVVRLIAEVASSLTREAAFASIARSLVGSLGAQASSVYVLGGDGNTLELLAQAGLERLLSERSRVELNESLPLVRCVRLRKVQVVEEEGALSGETCRNPGDERAAVTIGFSMPLVGTRQVIGAVTARFRCPVPPEVCGVFAELQELLGNVVELVCLRAAHVELEAGDG